MALFDRDRREENPRTRRLYAAWELVYTLVDFGAAAAFLIGSVLFLYESLQTCATWFFIVGSALFAFKPTIRTWRDIKLASMGDVEELEKEERMG
ncbi:YrhK family protein [Halomonas daqiaonensis]|uniref:YrhK-like protein n=1 Tax=Halomonas daqiaonensis TaxID=650850 RepID=A0A1H7RS61_9GAMM|nr:YrhK family protein [Halomonas daqiaonensis]SEL63053.1 YrhK-like protein [Halomonas daqiaonensis]